MLCITSDESNESNHEGHQSAVAPDIRAGRRGPASRLRLLRATGRIVQRARRRARPGGHPDKLHLLRGHILELLDVEQRQDEVHAWRVRLQQVEMLFLPAPSQRLKLRSIDAKHVVHAGQRPSEGWVTAAKIAGAARRVDVYQIDDVCTTFSFLINTSTCIGHT